MPSLTNRPRARRWARGTVACALAGLAAACAFPTDAPILEQHWTIPAESSAIGVGQVLPSTVTISGSEFAIAVDPPAPVAPTLYQDCATCLANDGQTIPKPQFTAVAVSSTNLPADVASAVLTAGAVVTTIRNNYAFDPLHPASGVNGTIRLRVTNGATVLGTSTLSGIGLLLPPGGTLTVAVPLAGPASGSDPIVVRIEIDSPPGDPVRMTAAQHIVVESVVPGVRASTASVQVTDRLVSATSEVDLSDIEDAITERLDSAAIRLTITNPFEAAGSLTATLETPGRAPLTRTFPLIGNAENTVHVLRYSRDEIQPYFGQAVTLRVSGSVGAAAPVTVGPAELVSIGSRLDLFLALGR